MTEVESDAMTPQAVAEYAVWYARKVKGPASDVARWLLEEFPWLREPLEVAATPVADTAGETMTIPIAKFIAMTTRIGQLEEAVADTAGIDAAHLAAVLWAEFGWASPDLDQTRPTLLDADDPYWQQAAERSIAKLADPDLARAVSRIPALAAALRTPKPEGER